MGKIFARWHLAIAIYKLVLSVRSLLHFYGEGNVYSLKKLFHKENIFHIS